MAMMAPQPQMQAQPAAAQVDLSGSKLAEVAQGQQQAGQGLIAGPETAMLNQPGQKAQLSVSYKEKLPETLKSATSMNTAAAFAGLKPWSKDWVFEGGMDINPNLKPLFDDASATALQQMRGDAEQAAAGSKAGVAVADSVSLSQLDGMLAGLQGGVESAGVGAGTVAEGLNAKKGDPAKAGARLATADDFLGTLNMVRGGQSMQSSGNLGQDMMSGKNPNQSGLKVIEGGLKGRKGSQGMEGALEDKLAMLAGGAGLAAGANANGLQQQKPTELAGNVTLGAGAQERLSSESLSSLSAGIRTLSPQGGGEIRMRLNPGNLGELHIRIVTQGDQVGLRIHASSDRAKRVIEESMSHLKEGLAAQQLNLSNFDLSVVQNTAGTSAQDGRFSQNDPSQNGAFQNFSGQQMSEQGGRNQNQGNASSFESEMRGMARPSAARSNLVAAAGAGGTAPAASSSRLDVRA